MGVLLLARVYLPSDRIQIWISERDQYLYRVVIDFAFGGCQKQIKPGESTAYFVDGSDVFL